MIQLYLTSNNVTYWKEDNMHVHYFTVGHFVDIPLWLQQTQELYAESPSEKLKKDLASIQNRIQLLERQLQSSTHSNLLQSRVR